MSKRIFCDKCMRMALAHPKDNHKKSGIWESNCGCKIMFSEIKDIEVKTKYYTKKHGDLTNQSKQVMPRWIYKKGDDKK